MPASPAERPVTRRRGARVIVVAGDEVLLQTDGSTRLIRRAETPEDYFATAIWD